MDQVVTSVLADYEKRAAEENKVMFSTPPEQIMGRIDDFLICVGPDTGRMLHLLATGAQAKSILEPGASYGYSTVWLADAARSTGGKVHPVNPVHPVYFPLLFFSAVERQTG